MIQKRKEKKRKNKRERKRSSLSSHNESAWSALEKPHAEFEAAGFLQTSQPSDAVLFRHMTCTDEKFFSSEERGSESIMQLV